MFAFISDRDVLTTQLNRDGVTLTSMRKISYTRYDSVSGSDVVKTVRNHDDANIDTLTFCDWKCAYSVGRCSWQVRNKHTTSY